MSEKKYVALAVSAELAEELKIWRQAYGVAAGRPVSYTEMFASMLECVGETDPDVVAVLDSMIERHPELAQRLAHKKETPSNVEECPLSESES